ncbi:MAG: hypothetical protein HYZ00_02765 [Candidatus Hydrogenedentes bacterium]|nr:hypothetical protein [Candidatus Hydrogenedentota bacterium]
MNKLLEVAMARAKALPEAQQDAIAALILEEIEEESHWDELFGRSPDVLENLAKEAEEEDRLGLTEELDPNKL